MLKLPRLKVEVPRPRGWDLAAGAVLLIGLAVAGGNLIAALGSNPEGPLGADLSLTFVFVQLAVSLGSLLLLGKTAKQGTIWGNLSAVAGMFVGLGGVLMAAALWAAA